MLGILIEFPICGQLHDASQIHDGHPVADMLHHAQVVGDEEVGEVHLFLELDKEVDDLGLD